jgi:gas vesicle protein
MPDVTVIETDSGATVKWFLLGALIGAGAGILLAPQSGERTRRDLARRAKRLRDDAEDRLEEFGDEIQSRGRKIKGAVEDWADDVKEEVRDGKRAIVRTADNARDELERRLADARARRRAAVAEGVADDADDDDLEDDDDDEATA